MATRCNIIIKRNEEDLNPICLYHHWDGYPEGVGHDLYRYLLEHKCLSKTGLANKLVREGLEMDGNLDKGYEITDNIHGDIEYIYIIRCDLVKVTCKHYRYGDDPCNIDLEEVFNKLSSK